MKQVEKSALVWFSPEQMFDLVNDVLRYPEFLPWCDHTKIIEQDDKGITAEVGIAISRIKQSFITHNTYFGKERMTIKLVSGPFSHLEGEWNFIPLTADNDQEKACRVSLILRYDFNSTALRLIVGPIFDRIANTFVEAFVKRAKEIYQS